MSWCIEDKNDGRTFLGDDVEIDFYLINLSEKPFIVRVQVMHKEDALFLNAVDAVINDESKHAKTDKATLLSALQATQPLIAEAQVRFSFLV